MKPFAIEELIEAIREVMRTRGGTNVCFGSIANERRHRQAGPLLVVKQTQSGAKRTLPLEGRLSGVERSYRRQGPTETKPHRGPEREAKNSRGCAAGRFRRSGVV